MFEIYLKQEGQNVQTIGLIHRFIKCVVFWIVMYHVHLKHKNNE